MRHGESFAFQGKTTTTCDAHVDQITINMTGGCLSGAIAVAHPTDAGAATMIQYAGDLDELARVGATMVSHLSVINGDVVRRVADLFAGEFTAPSATIH